MSTSGDPRRRDAATVAVIGVILGIVLLAGCDSGGRGNVINVEDPAVGATPGESAAVYLSLDNGGAEDTLVGASCDCSATVSMHTTEDDQGITTMVTAERIDLPSGETIVFDPGRSHLMLEDLDAPLEVGTRISLTLRFEHGRDQTVEVPVVPLDELAERVHG